MLTTTVPAAALALASRAQTHVDENDADGAAGRLVAALIEALPRANWVLSAFDPRGSLLVDDQIVWTHAPIMSLCFPTIQVDRITAARQWCATMLRSRHFIAVAVPGDVP
jgi:hypothetical protein